MKGKFSFCKRVTSLFVCLAMLFGLVAVMPVAAETEVSKFEFAVTDIAPYVNNKYTASGQQWMAINEGGTHANTADAKAVHAKVNAAFDVYYNHLDTHFQTQSGVFNSLPVAAKTAIGGLWINRWLHTKSGWGIPEGQRKYMDTIQGLVAKGEDGEKLIMKNFETTFSLYFNHYFDQLNGNTNKVKGWNSGLLAFRQQYAGKFVDGVVDGVNTVNKEQGIICITPWGISVGAGDSINDAMYSTDAIAFDQPSADGYFTVNVKVVNGECWITITDYEDGTVLFNNGGEPFAVDFDEEGYIAYGLGSCQTAIGDITLTRLDDEGNAIDIANPAPESFEFQVTDIAPYVNNKYTASGQQWMAINEGGTHANTDDAKAVHAKVNAAFDVYYNHLDTHFQTQSGVFNSLPVAAKTAIGGLWINRWLHTKSGWGIPEGQRKYMDTIQGLVAKDTDGETLIMKNFETTFSLYFNHYFDQLSGNTNKVKGWNSGLLAFRQQTAGKFVDGVVGGVNTVNKEQGVICITPWGISVGAGDSINDAMYSTDAIEFDQPSTDGYFTVNVKVVNGDCWITITDYEDGTVLFNNGGEPFAVDFDEYGYLAYGLGSCQTAIGDITLTRLDDEGNMIDISNPPGVPVPNPDASEEIEVDGFEFSVTDAVPFSGGKYTNGGGQSWMSFADNGGHKDTEGAAAIREILAENFAVYYNNDDEYMQTEVGEWKAEGASVGATFDQLYNNKWLQRQNDWDYGDDERKYMRLISSLAPLNQDGEEIVLKNFETTVEVDFEHNTQHGWNAFLLGFRQENPGKFVDDAYVVNKDQAFVIVTPWGMSVAGGEGIDNTMYDTDVIDFGLSTGLRTVTVIVKAVNDKVWVTVASGGQIVYNNGGEPFTVDFDKAGYITYGLGSCKNSFADIELFALDDEGKKVSMTHTHEIEIAAERDPGTCSTAGKEAYYKCDVCDLYFADANGEEVIFDLANWGVIEGGDHDFTNGDCVCGEQAPNTAKVNDRIITVKADEGYELKAGALVVTDANGRKWVPVRVGYRDGGDASQYEIPAEAVAPYTLPTAEELFYQPGVENGLNMGVVGTSVTDNAGGGLRFIHRLNITTEGDKMYMMVDGVKTEVAEYGLLLAAQAVLKNPEDLDIETANDSMHVKQYVWPEKDVYYDDCADYVDIAVHITNILANNGGNIGLITRTYVKLADGAVYYGDVIVSSYNQANA